MSLTATVTSFEINESSIIHSLERNPIIATRLNDIVGYDKAAAIVKEAYKTNKPIIDVAESMTDLTRNQLIKLLDPKKLV